MKIPKQISTKTFLVFCLLTLLAGSIALYVVAQTPTDTFWITGGIYPGTPSYTIWRDGGNYFAKDNTGQIDFSGNNVSDIVIDALATGDSDLFFTAGTYEFDTTVMLPSNTLICGQNDLTIFRIDGDIPALFRTGSDGLGIHGRENFTFRNFQILGRQGTGDSEATNGITCWDSFNIIVENVKIQHVEGSALVINNCSNMMINNFYAEDVLLWQGISANGIFNSTVSNVITKDCNSYGLDFSFALDSVFDNLIMKGYNSSIKIDNGDTVDNITEHCTFSNVVLEDTGQLDVLIDYTYNCTFTNWVIKQTASTHGIRVGAECKSLLFSNIIIKDTGATGIYVVSGAQNIVLNGFYVENPNTIGLSVYANGTLISNGIIVDPSTNGIYVNAYYCAFSDITIHSSSASWSITETATADYNMFSGIHAYNTTNGIFLQGANSHCGFSWNDTTWIS